MLRLIIQTKRKYKQKSKKKEDNVEWPRMNEDRPQNKDDAQESDKESDEGETPIQIVIKTVTFLSSKILTMRKMNLK